MRIILFGALCLLLLNFKVFGQKVKTEKITVKQLHIPATPLPNHFKFFGVEFISKTDLIPQNKKINLNISGYEKSEINNADIIIRIEILNSMTEHKSEMKVTRSTSSSMQKPITKANVIAKVDLEFTTNLIDREGNVFHIINYPDYEVIRTGTFRSNEIDISDNSDSKIKGVSNQATAQAINSILDKIEFETQKYINEHFSYYKENIPFLISSGKGRKFDYSDLDEALKKFKNAAKIYSDSGFIKEVTSEFSECVIIWQNAVNENITKDNDSRISNDIITSLYHNLAVVYYLLEDYNTALEWAKKGNQSKENETLIKMIITRQQYKVT